MTTTQAKDEAFEAWANDADPNMSPTERRQFRDCWQAALAQQGREVSEITRQLIERDSRGREKYGATLDRSDLSAADWLQHMAEELMDAAGYALAAKRQMHAAPKHQDDACPSCHRAWSEHRSGYSASRCNQKPAPKQQAVEVTEDMVRRALHFCPSEQSSPQKWRWIAKFITSELLAAPKQQAVDEAGDESPIYYMRDNHTFKRLSNSVSAALVEIEAEFNAGYTHGMLCSHRSGFKDIHANGNTSRMAFLAECHAALLAALAGKTEVA